MNTPLHIAIQNGNIEIVKALLADECDLGARNADGLTPLELAVKLNHDEIVRLLLEKGAGHLPPTETDSLSPQERKNRISFWMRFVFIVYGIVTSVSIIYALITIGILTSGQEHRIIHRATNVIEALYGVFFAFPGLAVSLYCYFFFLFRIWEEVPRQFARTTPAMAAGLSLVPFFSWYWMFVALGGLYQDMNKTLESYGQEKRFNVTLMISACVVWLIIDLTSIILGLGLGVAAQMDITSPVVVFLHFVTIVSSLLWLAFTGAIFWIIRKDVLEFVDMKSRGEKTLS